MACRHCSNYIFILDFAPGSGGLGNCKTRRETLKFLDLVPPILEIWRYIMKKKQVLYIDAIHFQMMLPPGRVSAICPLLVNGICMY